MTVTAEFHFDFGSPNAYFCHRVLPQIEQRTGVRFTYVPILLGGVFKLCNNASPMVQFKDVKNKPAYQMLEVQRFIRKHKLSRFRMNSNFPVNTVQIMRGAVAAEMDGYLPQYLETVFVAMWEDSLKMDDAEVIRATLDKAGIDGTKLLARIQEQEVKDKLLKNTEATVERGTFGAPTFFVGGEIFFGKDRLRDVEEEIETQKAA